MFSSSTTNIFISSILLSSFIVIYFRRHSKSKESLKDSIAEVASIDKLQGPSSPSWLAGNAPMFFNSQNPGEEAENLVQRYGLACKIKMAFNEDTLFLADPKGMQYVLNTSGYSFHKREDATITRAVLGKNILGVDGDEHVRHRRILLPSFSQSHLHEIVPAFVHVTSKLTERWKDLIAAKRVEGVDVDLNVWLSRLTLDALGQGVLSYDFGALTDKPSEYVEAFRELFSDMFGNRTNFQLAMGFTIGRLPDFVGRLCLGSAMGGMNRFQKFMAISSEISTSIIIREKEAARLGKPQGKDLLSALIRANLSEDSKYQLTDDEVLSQLHVLTIAGHDTTSSTLQWVFYELACHPEAQTKIREEIKAVKEMRGVQELGASDLELLHYTIAVLKETLRFHPIALNMPRKADRDAMIPLAYPLKTVSGKEIRAIHIKQGQRVFMSLYGYNRIKDLWGMDADQWIPERFLHERESERSKGTLGVYAHLATFSSGVHACIGWRFAVLEMLAVMAGLLEHFEFAPATSNPTITKKMAVTVFPSVKGEHEARLPLFIRPIS